MSNMKSALSYLLIISGLILNHPVLAFDCTINLNMPNGVIEVCDSGFAGVKADSLVLSEDEVVGYIMLDNSAGVPINYLAYNNTGIFFKGAAGYNEPYYLFTVVGFDFDGDELPDLDQQSTDICGRTEIVFFPENFYQSEYYYCAGDIVGNTDMNICGNSAGDMPDAIYNVCFGDFGVAVASNLIVQENFHIRYLLHDSASKDNLGNIIAINETGIFYNDGSLPNNQDLFVSAFVGSLDENDMPVLDDTCASIALPGAPLRFYEAIEFVVVNQQSDEQTNATEITFSLTGGAPSFPLYSNDFLSYFIEGDYAGTAELNDEITITVFEDEFEIEVVNDDKFCEQFFSLPTYIDTLLNVWPGDVNRNGIVNNEDIALMGLYMDETGPARLVEHQNINWNPHPAEDWNKQHTNQIDLKHFDCNGDGTIDSLDIEAIVMHYGNQHNEPLSQVETIISDSISYRIVLLPVGEITNDSLTVNVQLQNIAGGNLNLQGAFFTIDYNYLLSGMDITEFNFLTSSWLGEIDQNLKTLVDYSENNQSIEIGFTRIDGNNSVGEGIIGQLQFTFEDHNCCNSDIYDLPTIQIHTAQANNTDAEFINLQSQLLQINSESLNETVSCEDNWLITNDIPFQNTYKASGMLETVGEVYVGYQQEVSYKANRVRLNNGFKVKEGALFHAGKSNCSSGTILTESEN